jgi:hypothetical protein
MSADSAIIANAKQEIQACDKESGDIRAALRALGPEEDDKEELNSVHVELVKVR